MSIAIFDNGGLRFWNEEEILLREQFIQLTSLKVKNSLADINKAWVFHRVEGPILHPRDIISSSYTDDDIL